MEDIKVVKAFDAIIKWGLVVLLLLVPLVFQSFFGKDYRFFKTFLATELILFLLIVCILKSLSEKKVQWIASVLTLPIVLFLIVSSLSVIKAINKYEAVFDLAQLFGYAALFFLIINNFGKKDFNLFIGAMILTASLVCLYDIAVLNKSLAFGLDRMRRIATLGYPNFVAQVLIIVLPLSIYKIFFSRLFWKKLIYALSFMLMLLMLLLTKTRGAWLGLAGGSFVMAILAIVYLKKEAKTAILKKAFSLAGIVVLLCFLLLLLAPGPVKESWLKPIGQRISSIVDFENPSNLTRIHIWRNSFQSIRKNPILGVGIGNFKVVYPGYRSVSEREITGRGITHSLGHNEFLQILAEQGALGLTFYLLFVFVLYRLCWRLAFSKGPLEENFLAIAFTGSLTATFIHATFSTSFHVPSTLVYFWMVVGMVSISYQQRFCKTAVAAINFRGNVLLKRLLLWPIIIAVWMFLSFIVIRPLIAGLYLRKGMAYANKKEYKEALYCYDKSLHFNHNAVNAYFLKANIHLAKGENQKAIANYQEALKLYPYYSYIYNNLGAAYVGMRRLDKAIELFQKAIEIDPIYAGAYYNLGAVYAMKGQRQKARENLLKTIEIDKFYQKAYLLLQEIEAHP